MRSNFYLPKMTTPRCPYCNAQGLSFIKSQKSGPFRVIFCGQCGAIHGVLPAGREPVTKLGHTEAVIKTPPPTPTEAPNHPPRETKTPLAEPPIQAPEQPKAKPPNRITKDKVGAMVAGGGYFALALLPPLCPKCNIEMEKFTVPEGHQEAGQEFWRCPNFQTCRQWQREG